MRQFITTGKEPNLQRLVVISALLHLIMIIFAFVPLKTGQREFKSYYVNLVGPLEVRNEVDFPKGNIKDDTAGSRSRTKRVIPQKMLPPSKEGIDKKKTIPDKTVKTKSNSDSEMALKKAEEIVAKEIERLRAIREISRHKREEKEKSEEIEIIRKKVHENFAGGRGIPGEGVGVDADSYYAIISEIIWSQWVYPAIESSGLEVIVSIKIDGKGNIVSQEIEKPSGNTLFDQSALRAISKANPLPSPPMGMETDIGVRFYL